MNEPHDIDIYDYNPSTQSLMNFLRKGIGIKTLFSLGQYEPCVCEERGLKQDLQEFYGI